MEDNKRTQAIEEIKSKLESVVVPPIEELNDPNTITGALKSMMDSIYGEGKVEIYQDEEDKNIINIGFTETILTNEVKLGGK